MPLIDSRLGPLRLLFLDRKGREFHPPLVKLATLGEFGEIATLAVQNAVLLQVRASLVAMVERSRLGGELHDGVTQRMFTLLLTLKELAELPELPAMPPGADELLDRAQRDVDAAGSQLRRALTQLTERAIPATPATSEGFEERLRHIVAEANAAYGLLADIELSGQGRTPAPERQRAMLRALQEPLVKIAKHAKATQVTVAVRRSVHHWVMEVHDDGRGQARQAAAESRRTTHTSACAASGTTWTPVAVGCESPSPSDWAVSRAPSLHRCNRERPHDRGASRRPRDRARRPDSAARAIGFRRACRGA